jgi:hypothetical protein
VSSSSRSEPEKATGYTCAICWNTIDAALSDGVILTASHPRRIDTQDLFVHRACVARALDSRTVRGELIDDAPLDEDDQ